jgi:hypothetical protein
MPGIETDLIYDLGMDADFPFTVYTDGTKAMVREITGWTLSFMLKRHITDADADALLTKTTTVGIVIAGVFNSAPGVNTQKATVTIPAAAFAATKNESTVSWELKRTNVGSMGRIAYGEMTLRRTVHRA